MYFCKPDHLPEVFAGVAHGALSGDVSGFTVIIALENGIFFIETNQFVNLKLKNFSHSVYFWAKLFKLCSSTT